MCGTKILRFWRQGLWPGEPPNKRRRGWNLFLLGNAVFAVRKRQGSWKWSLAVQWRSQPNIQKPRQNSSDCEIVFILRFSRMRPGEKWRGPSRWVQSRNEETLWTGQFGLTVRPAKLLLRPKQRRFTSAVGWNLKGDFLGMIYKHVFFFFCWFIWGTTRFWFPSWNCFTKMDLTFRWSTNPWRRRPPCRLPWHNCRRTRRLRSFIFCPWESLLALLRLRSIYFVMFKLFRLTHTMRMRSKREYDHLEASLEQATSLAPTWISDQEYKDLYTGLLLTPRFSCQISAVASFQKPNREYTSVSRELRSWDIHSWIQSSEMMSWEPQGFFHKGSRFQLLPLRRTSGVNVWGKTMENLGFLSGAW